MYLTTKDRELLKRLTLSGTGFDPAGTAAAEVDAHEAEANPHPVYLTPATLDITEFDDTDATYYFYGGENVVGDWQINRYSKTTFVKTSADEAGNPTKTSLALAWTDRLTLTYA